METETIALARLLFKKSRRQFTFSPYQIALNFVLNYSTRHPEFKTSLFRFIDILPTLKTNADVVDHFYQYLSLHPQALPFFFRPFLQFLRIKTLNVIWAAVIRFFTLQMAAQFIGGKNPEEALTAVEKLWDKKYAVTVDLLGEAAMSHDESNHYQAAYIHLIETLAQKAPHLSYSKVLEEASLGLIPRVNVSVKASSLYPRPDPLRFRESVDGIKARLRPILQAAVKNGAFVNMDMEQYDIREIILTVAEEIFDEEEFKAYPYFGMVIQAYLKGAEKDLFRLIQLSKKRSHPITIRLVKGAYWDYEVIQARMRGWESPVFLKKEETDANYEHLTEILLQHYPTILPAFASHNIRSLAYALSVADKQGLNKNAVEIQMLYGMAEAYKKTLAKMGYRTRVYLPVGELFPGMAYLVRRLLENSSNESFLKVKNLSLAESDAYLKKPTFTSLNLLENTLALTQISGQNTFMNEAMGDYSQGSYLKEIQVAFEKLKAKLPLTIFPIVNGKEVKSQNFELSSNPANKNSTVTRYGLSTPLEADAAIDCCLKSFSNWAQTDVLKRTEILKKAADLIHEKKNEAIALIVVETAKDFREAEADVAEAIDFCRYYAAQMEKIALPQTNSSLPGEANHYFYRPRGITVAIAPWNFPLAILCGMTVAPLVAGNPVIMKPAEQSSAVGAFLYNILREAGIPPQTLHFLSGRGEDVGAYLCEHKDISIITFTGSKEVGLSILEKANRLNQNSKHIKKVVAEMGGKNGMIIDADADLDEAVTGALHSAFGYQGQKCSALSRLIILEGCYEEFKKRFIQATLALTCGAPETAANVGPVIDEASQKRLLEIIVRHRNKIIGQLPISAHLLSEGHYVPPTIFEETDSQSELAQNEFFGPLVTLFKVSSFNEAIHAINDVDYALTAGVYSRNPQHIEEAKLRIEAGNLYINRGITGAMVARQPFGGYKLSGVGAKAGGPDYLLQFLEPISITENTMRRGFAPEI